MQGMVKKAPLTVERHNDGDLQLAGRGSMSIGKSKIAISVEVLI